MANIESVLSFDGYRVDELEFKTNYKYSPKNERLKIDFGIKKDVQHNENGEMKVSLFVNIFENATEKNYPFEMKLKITGFFTMSDETINLESNAIAILYPYVRAIVSVYTSNINVPQLILPVINVNALIEQLETQEKS